MGITISTTAPASTAYVPEFRGNRLSADPAWVEIQPMTAGELQARRTKDFGRLKVGADVLTSSRAHRNAVIGERVTAVHGIGVDANTPIADGKALVALMGKASDPAIDALLEELYNAITDHSVLEDGRRPNS